MSIVRDIDSERAQELTVCTVEVPHADPRKLLITLLPSKTNSANFLEGIPDATMVEAFPDTKDELATFLTRFNTRNDPRNPQPPKAQGKQPPLEDSIIAILRKQVQEHGTLKEVMIAGHGNSEMQGAGDDPTLTVRTNVNTLHTPSLLNKVKALQKELGVKVADRIIFGGCSVFTKLDDPEKVEYYRQTAQELGTQLVGSYNNVIFANGTSPQQVRNELVQIFKKSLVDHPEMTPEKVAETNAVIDSIRAAPELRKAHLMSGRFVQFTPEGEVKRDPLDKNPDGLIEKLGDSHEMVRAGFFGSGSPDAWVDCHRDKSQEEGAACQMKEQFPEAGWIGHPSATPARRPEAGKGLLDSMKSDSRYK